MLGRTSKPKCSSTAAESAFVILWPEVQLENLEGNGGGKNGITIRSEEVKGGPQESNLRNKKEIQKPFKGWKKCLSVWVLTRSICLPFQKGDWDLIWLVCKPIHKKSISDGEELLSRDERWEPVPANWNQADCTYETQYTFYCSFFFSRKVDVKKWWKLAKAVTASLFPGCLSVW